MTQDNVVFAVLLIWLIVACVRFGMWIEGTRHDD